MSICIDNVISLGRWRRKLTSQLHNTNVEIISIAKHLLFVGHDDNLLCKEFSTLF